VGIRLRMSVLILRCLLVSALAVGIPLSVLGQTTSQSPPAQTSPEQTSPSQTSPTQASPNQDTQAPGPPAQGPAAAILHAQGGVWVNGSEARDSTAIFSGDLLETKPGFSATLNLDGSELLLAPETVAKFDGDSLELDHGSVAVGTSKSFKVEVKCLTATPALSAWTQYEVSDLTGAVQVVARKSDVRSSTARKPRQRNQSEMDRGGRSGRGRFDLASDPQQRRAEQRKPVVAVNLLATQNAQPQRRIPPINPAAYLCC